MANNFPTILNIIPYLKENHRNYNSVQVIGHQILQIEYDGATMVTHHVCSVDDSLAHNTVIYCCLMASREKRTERGRLLHNHEKCASLSCGGENNEIEEWERVNKKVLGSSTLSGPLSV